MLTTSLLLLFASNVVNHKVTKAHGPPGIYECNALAADSPFDVAVINHVSNLCAITEPEVKCLATKPTADMRRAEAANEMPYRVLYENYKYLNIQRWYS